MFGLVLIVLYRMITLTNVTIPSVVVVSTIFSIMSTFAFCAHLSGSTYIYHSSATKTGQTIDTIHVQLYIDHASFQNIIIIIINRPHKPIWRTIRKDCQHHYAQSVFIMSFSSPNV